MTYSHVNYRHRIFSDNKSQGKCDLFSRALRHQNFVRISAKASVTYSQVHYCHRAISIGIKKSVQIGHQNSVLSPQIFF